MTFNLSELFETIAVAAGASIYPTFAAARGGKSGRVGPVTLVMFMSLAIRGFEAKPVDHRVTDRRGGIA